MVSSRVAGFGALDCAAAEGENERVADGEAGDGGVFAVTERSFAVAGEEIGDGCAGFGLDHVIDIDELPAEARGEERADGAFAGAHEAGEDDAAQRLCGAGSIGPVDRMASVVMSARDSAFCLSSIGKLLADARGVRREP